MDLCREEEFLRLTDIILNTAKAAHELIEGASIGGLDELFGGILEKLNNFFKKVEDSFREFVIFERYTTCAYTPELGYSIRDIPEDVKRRVWELRENTEICGFTGEECKCKRSVDYLKERFSEKLRAMSSQSTHVKSGSEELSRGIEELSGRMEMLTVSTKKIINIAEIIEIISLNAYIEAARLGEAGRGFKVIADEVRRASVRTNELASEIISAIKELQEMFSRQMHMQQMFNEDVKAFEAEQREFSDKLNRDLMWMAQNFMDFMEYVRESVKEDIKLLTEVRQVILSSLQTIDLTNQRIANTCKALEIVADMIEDFERVLRGEKSASDSYTYISRLYEDFKKIPKLREERETIARVEGNEVDYAKEVVGEKLEDAETDIELF